jgi:type I restriction enzyme S subunit
MKWDKIEFGELYLIPSKNGLNRPSRVRGSGYKMINMGELFANDRIKDIPMELVQLNDREIESSKIIEKDLIFARQSIVASGAGKCSIVLEVPEITTFESHLIRIRLNQEKADPFFFYYYFKTPMANMKSLVQQGVQAGIRGSELKNLKVISPPLTIQRRIASILSAYDDLIENNLKRIMLLEEMAQLRYKEIIQNAKLEKIVLGDITEINRENLKSNYQIDHILYIDISSVTQGSIDEKTEYDIKDAPGRAKRVVKHQDIIWSCVRPNRKSYAIIWKPEENLIVSTGFAVISKSQIPQLFLYHCLSTDAFVQYLENNATGSAYPAVTTKDFEKAVIAVPSHDIMIEYQESSTPAFELINTLKKQNNKLREARNLLLPKLMSGEITV